MCSSNVHAIYSYILKTLHTSTSFVQFTKIINDQKIRNSIYYDLLFVNQSPNTEAQTLSIIDQRSLNRLLGTTIYGWRWSKKRCHRCWCKDQDREFTASSSSDERQGVRGTLGERSKERETIRYQVGCEARTRGGRARKKRLGRRGNDLCHSLVATPAPAADQRPALALNSGQAVDTGRALVLAAETATRERERGREQRAPPLKKSSFSVRQRRRPWLLRDRPSRSILSYAERGPKILHERFIAYTCSLIVFASRVIKCLVIVETGRKLYVGGCRRKMHRRERDSWMLNFCWTSNSITIRK